MFKIYDLKYNEVNFPVDSLGLGLKALDIEIGAIKYENVYSESSTTDTLVKRYPKDREVSIQAMFTAYDTVDYRLKRDRVYDFFRSLGAFFVAESHQPFKLLKVIIDEGYMPERAVTRWGMLDIPLKILDTPFKKSLYTTKVINNEGVRWNDKWAYGMGLSGDIKQWKYSFENENINFFNAGTEEIKLIKQKDSEITLTVKTENALTRIGISDGVNNFWLNRRVDPGDVIKIKGHLITLNGLNVMADTNGVFLNIKKGWNTWRVNNASGYLLEVDFRFIYD